MPLEPIEEQDLDLKNKFIEKKLEEGDAIPVQEQQPAPDLSAGEKMTERQEGAAEKDDAYSKIVSKIQAASPQTDDAQVKEDAQSASQGIDVESRVNNLVDIAMQKGVAHAVKVARHIEDNYVLDEFHDKLMADELHDALVEKGLIKNL